MLIGFVRIRRAVATTAVLALAVAACGGDDDDAAPEAGSTPDASTAADDSVAAADSEAVTLRLGYFPNVTHAPAVLGVETGLFEEALGDSVELELQTFNSGTEVIEAIFSDALDASFIGPNPAINGYARSGGEALRIVSGTTSGGASLVVREGIDAPADLAGITLATPSLGNTQDVALRAWLEEQGFETDTSGGGDVSITPQENADTLAAFQAGRPRRCVGARAVGHSPRRGGRWPRARRRSRALAGRALRDHTSHRGEGIPRRSPRRRP